MIQAVPGVLSRIVDHKRTELAGRLHLRAQFERLARQQCRRDFAAALQPPAIIAEIKKASPSKGLLTSTFEPRRLAKSYTQGGAACLSVLTDAQFFQGSLEDLQAARAECPLPVLRKDFTIDEFDVVEAAAHGADAILLIAAILSVGELIRFRGLAGQYGMAALVEVHDEEELHKAADSGATMIGVNNRNLRDFSVSLRTSERLAPRIPTSAIKVSESGIHTASDISRLTDCGYSAFLVGEHLMTAADPASALRALRQQ
jgi:indole-3-glycerol phosphate synthase